jgi:hypothetical protein
MNFESILRKLNAIGGMQGSVNEAKKPDDDGDGIPNWADDKDDKKDKANEDIMKVMRGLQAIQEADDTCSECGKSPCECDDKEEVKEAEEEKCSDCGHVHTGDCKVEESKDSDAGKDGPHGKPAWLIAKEKEAEGKEEVEEGVMDKVKAFGKKALDTLGHPDDEEMIKDLQRKAGVPVTGKKPEKKDQPSESISECGDMEMSPMTVVGGEPQMGINPAMPAEVPTIGAQTVDADGDGDYDEIGDVAPKATYTLSIQNGDNNLQMTTDVPDEIIHIMKLAGINKGAQVTQKPTGEEQQTDEAFGNTPAQTNEPNPRLHGDIADWGQKGTGKGKPEYPGTKASGDNPMHEALEMVLEYRKFKSNK